MDFHSDEINLRALRRKFPLILCFKVNFQRKSVQLDEMEEADAEYFSFVRAAGKRKRERREVADKLHLQKGGGQLFSSFSHFDVHIIFHKYDTLPESFNHGEINLCIHQTLIFSD